jgi:hypothetical protein
MRGRLNSLTSQRLNRFHECAGIEMPHKLDDIASDIAVATTKDLLAGIDAEAISAAAYGARATAISATVKRDAASLAFILDAHGSCLLDRGGDHRAALRTSATACSRLRAMPMGS